MPGLSTRSAQFGSAPPPVRSASPDGIWSKHLDSITFDQLHKFWSELPLRARKELLRLDKQTLFEQARRNLYCSRCNGLLLEGFSQIITYGKSLQQEDPSFQQSDRAGTPQSQNTNDFEVLDPSLHPWGGLTTTKHGILTVLDCFMCARSLKTLQNVFDNAQARERERELLYPDACGVGGRGWISQGMANYGRGHGHGARETCALHTARLSCDTLVDFWSALGEETRSSLLRMKEEDFIERLMYRFDNKRFCRDCRRNVIREFKELKEFKRMRKEPRCTRWFCVADLAFQYEVSEDTVQADWNQSFTDMVGTYHHFEWAIGTGEGQTDILDFKDVGMNGKVEETGLNLGGLGACFITLRAWKLDGRCIELCVKAHALKGQHCVHRRLIVGDGFVTITEGESIRRFFEHAEEAEEEEDDDAMDKDENELDDDNSRSQKHAKSPELAREFLLDAATVIFKEQVEKAFREGTARQNAHCTFVCLALELLEERLHVACKEIITLEKQTKLLEEEEKEKRKEEERKERRRTKEREKKLRRKERLKEKGRERKLIESKSLHAALPESKNKSSPSTYEESIIIPDSADFVGVTGDISLLEFPVFPDVTDEQSSGGSINMKTDDSLQQQSDVDGKFYTKSGLSFTSECTKSLRRKLRSRKENFLEQSSNCYDRHRFYISNESRDQQDETDISTSCSRGINGLHWPSRERFVMNNHRKCALKFNEKSHCAHARVQGRFDFQCCNCSCNKRDDYNEKDGYHIFTIRSGRERKTASRIERELDMPRSSSRNVRYNNGCYFSDNFVVPKGKHVGDTPGKEILHTKQVWEPLDTHKKISKSNSDSKITFRCISKVESSKEICFDKGENGCQQSNQFESVGNMCSSEHSTSSGKVDTLIGCQVLKDHDIPDGYCLDTNIACQNEFGLVKKTEYCSNKGIEENLSPIKINCSDTVRSSSSSDNCFSCISEGDSSTSSSSLQNAESSLSSDSEDACQQSCARDASVCNNDSFHEYLDQFPDKKIMTNRGGSFANSTAEFLAENFVECDLSGGRSKNVQDSNNGQFGFVVSPPPNCMLPMRNNSIHVPVISSPMVGYHTQHISSWAASPCNGFIPFPQANHYLLPTLGCGLPANRLSDLNMHYNIVQPLNVPVFDARKEFMYQTGNRMNVRNSEDQNKHPSFCGFQQLNTSVQPIGSQRFLERSFSDRQLPSKQSAEQNGSAECCAKSHNGSSSFSLFHFGGPMAGTNDEFIGKLPSLEDETTGGFVSNLTTTHAQPCSKEEIKVEEYCLFSSRNSTRFSFF
ncbi:unnamed protein product [Musa acuminata subsp. malaccensis]|uniref:(wild Malaysian banana) hypothetical protein n=1 Tax=Musa acuminata subsp. malaccensis TaxID=214687 RepID=A0A804J4W5_MUSAM|nr:PREDICTED: uncharacterized protein LOC103974327 [Musa acuminata subsp. malaccensis]CAG1838821.1 unnamed protein product [Musa acuminata subsp. malaccensis]